MAGDELQRLVMGKNIRYSDGAIASYKTDGRYEYNNGGTASRGTWSVQGNRLCVDFDNGRNRCDQVFKEGVKMFLKNSNGTKFSLEIL